MTETSVPRGRALFIEESLDALGDAQRQYGEQQPEFNAIYLALRALTYATLAAGEPPADEIQASPTFGEPYLPATAPRIGEATGPLSLYTISWERGTAANSPTLQFQNIGGEVTDRWPLHEEDLTEDGAVRDIAQLAAWITDCVITDASSAQGWTRDLTAAARERAAALIADEA